jgi:hypothetical protein
VSWLWCLLPLALGVVGATACIWRSWDGDLGAFSDYLIAAGVCLAIGLLATGAAFLGRWVP